VWQHPPSIGKIETRRIPPKGDLVACDRSYFIRISGATDVTKQREIKDAV
jgi:hypothetical protein